MLRPSELLDAARSLASPSAGSPSDAESRRSVSTAYYALFHTVLTAGADRFFGSLERGSAGYAILYRSFDHGRMKRVCEDAARSTLTLALQKQLRRSSFYSDLRDFTNSFVILQAFRHSADYDPDLSFDGDDASAAIDLAGRAITSFASAPDDERSDLLALMLGGRS